MNLIQERANWTRRPNKGFAGGEGDIGSKAT